MGERDGGTEWAHVVSMLEEIVHDLDMVENLEFTPDMEALTNALIHASRLLERAKVMAKREAVGDGC